MQPLRISTLQLSHFYNQVIWDSINSNHVCAKIDDNSFGLIIADEETRSKIDQFIPFLNNSSQYDSYQSLRSTIHKYKKQIIGIWIALEDFSQLSLLTEQSTNQQQRSTTNEQTLFLWKHCISILYFYLFKFLLSLQNLSFPFPNTIAIFHPKQIEIKLLHTHRTLQPSDTSFHSLMQLFHQMSVEENSLEQMQEVNQFFYQMHYGFHTEMFAGFILQWMQNYRHIFDPFCQQILFPLSSSSASLEIQYRSPNFVLRNNPKHGNQDRRQTTQNGFEDENLNSNDYLETFPPNILHQVIEKPTSLQSVDEEGDDVMEETDAITSSWESNATKLEQIVCHRLQRSKYIVAEQEQDAWKLNQQLKLATKLLDALDSKAKQQTSTSSKGNGEVIDLEEGPKSEGKSIASTTSYNFIDIDSDVES